MRQIKFRAWDKIKNKMVYQDELKYCSQWLGQILTDTLYTIPMQFTGLLDESGREIYEGDLVKEALNILEPKPVVQTTGGWGIQLGENAIIGFDPRMILKVVGNIYENS